MTRPLAALLAPVLVLWLASCGEGGFYSPWSESDGLGCRRASEIIETASAIEPDRTVGQALGILFDYAGETPHNNGDPAFEDLNICYSAGCFVTGCYPATGCVADLLVPGFFDPSTGAVCLDRPGKYFDNLDTAEGRRGLARLVAWEVCKSKAQRQRPDGSDDFISRLCADYVEGEL